MPGIDQPINAPIALIRNGKEISRSNSQELQDESGICWRKSTKEKRKKKDLAEALDPIARLPVQALADPLGCYVAVWITNNPMIEHLVLEVFFPKWKMVHETTWTWLKLNAEAELVCSVSDPRRKPYERVLVGYYEDPVLTCAGQQQQQQAFSSLSECSNKKIIHQAMPDPLFSPHVDHEHHEHGRVQGRNREKRVNYGNEERSSSVGSQILYQRPEKQSPSPSIRSSTSLKLAPLDEIYVGGDDHEDGSPSQHIEQSHSGISRLSDENQSTCSCSLLAPLRKDLVICSVPLHHSWKPSLEGLFFSHPHPQKIAAAEPGKSETKSDCLSGAPPSLDDSASGANRLATNNKFSIQVLVPRPTSLLSSVLSHAESGGGGGVGKKKGQNTDSRIPSSTAGAILLGDVEKDIIVVPREEDANIAAGGANNFAEVGCKEEETHFCCSLELFARELRPGVTSVGNQALYFQNSSLYEPSCAGGGQ